MDGGVRVGCLALICGGLWRKNSLLLNMDRDIEESITLLESTLSRYCPRIGPSIFPTRKNFGTSLSALCTTSSQRDRIASEVGTFPIHVFTKIDYNSKTITIMKIEKVDELDSKLTNLEYMMGVLCTGSEEEVRILYNHFASKNGLDASTTDKSILSDVYNIAYNLKVLLSNVPFTIEVNKPSSVKRGQAGVPLPFAEDVNVVEVISSILDNMTNTYNKASNKKRKENDNTDNSSDDESESEEEVVKKRKKRSRSKKK